MLIAQPDDLHEFTDESCHSSNNTSMSLVVMMRSAEQGHGSSPER